MESETSKPNNHKTLVLLGTLVLITIAGSIIPATWFNVDRPNQSLDLTSVDTIDVTPRNKDTDRPLTWKQLAEEAFSEQPEVLEQLKALPVDNDVISQLNDEENLTASFSKNLYLASAYLKENGITDESAKQEVVNQLIEQEASKIVPTTYLYKDLKVSRVESRDSIKAYGNAVASTLSGFITQKSLNDDLLGVANYINDQDPSSLTALKKDSIKMSATVQKMLTISVPESAVVYHLSALNHLAVYQDTLNNLSKIETDALRANIALKDYIDVVVSAVSVYKDLSDYFNIKNIAFSGNEPGYVFTVGYTLK